MMNTLRSVDVCLVAGEESGDQLGGKLMSALRERLAAWDIRFSGVGGERMAHEGLQSLFPMADVAVMGLTAVIQRLPTLINRVHRTVDAIVATKPDILVIIDSPGFTHAVASRVRKRLPSLPIVDYVSPSVWAWRPGRARVMRAYVDHLMALLPFEPEVHRRLGGPVCTHVGHPLVERLDVLRPKPGERPPLGDGLPVLLVLPGSRRTEISRLMGHFGEALRLVVARYGPVKPILPAVSHLVDDISLAVSQWPVKPEIVTGEAAKFTAFRSAHAALAASGTVTLELALAGVPMVVAYRVSKIEEWLMPIVSVSSFVLPNLILEENAIPEFIQRDCSAESLADALEPLLVSGPVRQAQLDALGKLDRLMTVGEGTPSERAAAIVADVLERSQAR